MSADAKLHRICTTALTAMEEAGTFKQERALSGPQSAHVKLASGGQALNLCANNYLGLADDQHLIRAAKSALDTHGFGMASVRFICGTQGMHQQLEAELAAWLGTEDAILFSSCFDANAGVFEALLGPEDVIISDALNHASLIDGIRLCKAQRLRYANNNMAELEAQLIAAHDARLRLIVTDGVFSMDGIIANLPAITELAARHDALVLVDDSHAVGFMGSDGSGTPAHCGVKGQIALLTGTFGKALGGASGGYVAGPRAAIAVLRQRARPYLFSNALAPAICAATLKAIEIARSGQSLRAQLFANATYFRAGMSAAGFRLAGADHPIIPVMVGEAQQAQAMANALAAAGLFVTAFSYPVVPMGQARLRTQMSAAHDRADLDRAIAAFTLAGRNAGVIS